MVASSRIEYGPSLTTLPARSLAVKITWLVAPQGLTPPQRTVLLELVKLRPVTVSVCADVVPSRPVMTPGTGTY